VVSFQRDHVATLVRRLAEQPRFIIALFGPRQTGKTTIVRQALRRIDRPSLYLAIDEPDSASLEIPPTPPGAGLRRPGLRNTEWLVLNWERARLDAERSPDGSVLVLDEIQKILQWSETVKGLWDADRAVDRPLHVVILGSAPLLMQSGLTESLAGRFEPIRVTHWALPEMAAAFDFDLSRYLFFGGYPGAASLVRDPEQWRDHWRDVQHEVDFVLRRGPRLVGIEVKSGPRPRSPRGLEVFEARFDPQRILVVGEGGVPLNEFLAAPAGYWCEEG